MSNVASLTSKRGGNRGAVTRLINKISDIIADAAMDRDRKIYELNKKLEDLHDKIKVVEALDSEIVDLFAAADMEAEMANAGGINAVSYDARDAAEFTLKTLMDEKAAEVAAAAAASAAAAAALPNSPISPSLTSLNLVEIFYFGMRFWTYSRWKFIKKRSTPMLLSSTSSTLVYPATQRRFFSAWCQVTTTTLSPSIYSKSVLASRQKSSWLTCEH